MPFLVGSLATLPAVVAVSASSGGTLTTVVAGSLAATAVWVGLRAPDEPIERELNAGR